MNSEPISIFDVDINKLTIKPKKETGTKNANGRMYYVLHNNNKLRVYLPEMSAPFGAGNSEKFPEKYTMAITFDGMNEDTSRGRRLKKAHTKMVEIDKKISQLLFDNRDTVYKDNKKKIADIIIRGRYSSFIHPSDDEEHADKMYITLQRKRVPEKERDKYTEEQRIEYEKRFTCMADFGLVITPNGDQLDVTTENVRSMIPYGSIIKPCIELCYIFIMGNNDQKTYPVWNLIHSLLVSSKSVSNFDLRKTDESDDGEDEEDKMDEDEDVKDAESQDAGSVAITDDEEEAEA
jgi:hypothetical protein